MIRKILTASVSALALGLTVPAAAQDSAERAPTPTMDYGTWGFNPESLDRSVDPGDDFFDYVNGKWIEENPIPAEFSRFGAFNILGEKSTADVEKLVADLVAQKPAAGTPERRIVDAYQSFLDTRAIDEAGLVPAYPYLTEIFQAPDLAALVELFEEPGYPGLVGAGVTVDSKNPDQYAVSVGFDGMGLPDRDYYLVDNERNLEIRQAYKDYLAFLLGEAGYADPQKAAEAVYQFEHKVAELEWDRTMLRNRDLTYNSLSRDELAALAPDFPVEQMLNAAGFGDVERILAPQLPPSEAEAEELGLSQEDLAKIGGGLPAMMELLTDVPLANVKAFMAAQFLSSHSAVLPSRFDEAHFALFSKMLNGQDEQRPRWKRAIAATEGQLGEQLGALYVEQYFPPEAKAQMDELITNLRKALAQSLQENDWMTEATKERAMAKLDSFTPKVGYPEEFETYEGLEIMPGDALGNRVRAIEWAVEDNRSKLGEPVDKTEWGMLPQTVNAYYNPVFNEIVFPAAILQPPFFDPDADPAVNYGSKYDATGALENWWEDADREKFEQMADKLVEQYNQYCPYDDGETCVNGRLTLGENIGDVGGLSMAYRAYRMSLNGEEAPVIDGLTGDQRFFLSWAQVWRSMQREAAGRQRLLTDPHSPEEFRVNGAVRNQDAWYQAFNITPEDDLYLPPEERIEIW
jgi:putative endopeptidase